MSGLDDVVARMARDHNLDEAQQAQLREDLEDIVADHVKRLGGLRTEPAYPGEVPPAERHKDDPRYLQ